MKKIGKTPNAFISVLICIITFIGIFDGNVHIMLKIEDFMYPTTLYSMSVREVLTFTFMMLVLCCVLWKFLEILVKKKYLIGTMIVFLVVYFFGAILELAAEIRIYVMILTALQVLFVLCMVLLERKKEQKKAVKTKKGAVKK